MSIEKFWNPARVELLKNLLSQGLSGSQIAAQLGTTRNAVIGKVSRDGFGFLGMHRAVYQNRWIEERVAILRERKAAGVRNAKIADELGITEHAVRSKARRLGLDPSYDKMQVGALGGLTRTLNLMTAQKKRAPSPEPVAPPHPRKPGGISIFELTSRTCRWPFGDLGRPDFFFCGAVPSIGPYCHEHGSQAYHPLYLPGR